VVKLAGVVDLLGAIGLILPAMLRIGAKLIPIAGIGIILLMLCAMAFHIERNEVSVIGVNLFVIVVAAFVVWGRVKVPIGSNINYNKSRLTAFVETVMLFFSLLLAIAIKPTAH